METSNIDKKKINESLNTLLGLFDEGEAVLKGPALPTNPALGTDYEIDELVENIASKKIVQHSVDFATKRDEPSSVAENKFEGLSLSQRLKAKLNSSRAQVSSIEQDDSRKKVTLSQGDFLSSRLISTQQQQQQQQQQQNQSRNQSNIQGSAVSSQMNALNDFDASNASYNELHDYVMNCTHCPECSNRLNVLFGEGKLPSRLMIIGEGPGRNEDATGRLFVGPSGDFLSKWLSSIHLDMREDVYLSNIVKCFSGTNPTPQRADYCKHFLEKQIEFVKPEAILILGKVAANSLLNNQLPLNQMRERDLTFKGIPVVVTYHPAAVLRNEQWKRPVWRDLQLIASILKIELKRR